jgi:hypothetical protein
MSQCKNCVNYRYGWCDPVTDSPDPNIDRECRHFHQKTNGDYIRLMAERNEWLAAFICGIYPVDDNSRRVVGVVLCDDESAVKEWLFEPYKGV